MATRTIEIDAKTSITPAAGGRILVRSSGCVEVIKAPIGSARLSVTNQARSVLSFGSPNRTTLVVTGAHDSLAAVFEAVTGVKP